MTTVEHKCGCVTEHHTEDDGRVSGTFVNICGEHSEKPQNHSPDDLSRKSVNPDKGKIAQGNTPEDDSNAKLVTSGTSKLNGRGCGKKKIIGCEEMGWLDCGDKVGVWKGKEWVWTKDYWLCDDCKPPKIKGK